MISLFAGILLIAGAVFGFAKYMKGYELDVTMMKTIKPAGMIQAGELITANMLREVSIPTVQHMDNAIVDVDKIIGKRAVTPIGEMEEFLSWKISEDSLYPAKDETYIGFKVDFVGAVNNMIRRGDKVDVYVEYNTPKLLDSAGNEIDLTIRDAGYISGDTVMPEIAKKVYNEKLILGLTVAYVKDQDGKEIIDNTPTTTLGIPLNGSQKDEVNMERYRQGALAQPAFITFIISEEDYAKLAEGQKKGLIKLGLPRTAETIGMIVPHEQTKVLMDTEVEKKAVDSSDLNQETSTNFENTKQGAGQ
ncbi:hypothetical protein BK120_23180 [Paenibacillus sp. FSL A5-0031]|nr:hypothetical protein BK120_23180 [Paenibacillus sp. FSL A5-0031]